MLDGYILAGLANDSGAQSGVAYVTFDEIACRMLNVVDDEVEKLVELIADEPGGVVAAYGKDSGWAS